MTYFKAIWNIIRGSSTSTCRNKDGALVMRNGLSFKGLPISKQEEITDIITDTQKKMIERGLAPGDKLTTMAQVRDSAAAASRPIAEYALRGSGGDIAKRVMDSMFSGQGYNLNNAPQFGGMMMPNLWVDPGEAASIYAGGGLPALIINKKSKSIRHNGIKIINPLIPSSDMEKVNESAERTGLARALTDGCRDGLTYGGSLVFPMFKKEMPASLLMGVGMLAKLGIVGKGCIDRYVCLDRNNAITIPNWNPTAEDFLNPRTYFIPYLGSDVSGQRCARIVPLPQAGYWGALMTMGWGTSDIVSWFQAVCNYESVAYAIPTMIKQMSILVRTFNIDLTNALNGVTDLTDLDRETTIAMHEASNEDPISMDVIGDVKAIERDFTAVAELTRIVRQDVGAKSMLPEEQLWSSDRGAFGSGDQTDGINERQWEGIKFINHEIQDRAKNLAMLEIINALGKDRDEVMRVLSSTRVEIMGPRIENAETRSTIAGALAAGVFDLVASGMQLESALSIVLPYGDDHLAPTDDVLKKIKEHQEEADEREKEDHDLDTQLKQKQIDAPVAMPGQGGGSSSASLPKKKSEGYTPLEQRQHEKTRGTGARREGLARMQGKKVGK
jgi:hypothetical protein